MIMIVNFISVVVLCISTARRTALPVQMPLPPFNYRRYGE